MDHSSIQAEKIGSKFSYCIVSVKLRRSTVLVVRSCIVSVKLRRPTVLVVRSCIVSIKLRRPTVLVVRSCMIASRALLTLYSGDHWMLRHKI